MSKIVVLRLNEKRDEYTLTKQIPKEMKSEIFKRVGSEFARVNGKSTKEIIRGLDTKLEKIYLPKIIGVHPESLEFDGKARDFWADYVITPTVEGLRLDISMIKKKDDEDNDVDVPANPEDYMAYKFAMQSSKVAKTEDELENIGFYDFILEDLSKIEEKEVSQHETNKKAIVIYAKLTSKLEENMNKINFILELTKEEGVYFDTDISDLKKDMQLKKLAEERPLTLISLFDDKDLEKKAFLSQALTFLIIQKEGNDYFYMDENMGSQDKGALSWLDKPEKSGAYAAIKSKLEQAIKDKKKI